ncbi:hypothetical protein O53_1917 [Microcystis aeruginosa TAIHU98]|uniref:Uncharacterized protein n=1 Tax=Microcystis aeruginosa TAIHU98 TaxID=1134457 RepID=L7EE71_MICAE|nr:hypothetical protein O53_1917 [Microcystis aeruginosa TAIHU98]
MVNVIAEDLSKRKGGSRCIPTGVRSCGEFLCYIFLNQES